MFRKVGWISGKSTTAPTAMSASGAARTGAACAVDEKTPAVATASPAGVTTIDRNDMKADFEDIVSRIGRVVLGKNAQVRMALTCLEYGAVDFVAMWWRDQPDIPAEAVADLLARAFSPNLLELATMALPSAPVPSD